MEGSEKTQELSDILKTITEEMQKSLSAKNAVGDPVTVEGKTVIPLMSVGMGFGAGSGAGKADGPNGGGGGALGMKPVAVIIIDQDGVRVERLKEAQHTLIEHVADAVPKLLEGLTHKKETHVQIKGEDESS
ncbi:MAG: spore germination protein GerW family protein [Methanothrix sp.]|nr:spore germination protein GerW family protein [Methanothrix sp.]MDD4446602.1 spore germination protein GerW family protein [Methanothrix sp.]